MSVGPLLRRHAQTIWLFLLVASVGTLASGAYVALTRNGLPDSAKTWLAFGGTVVTGGGVSFVSWLGLKGRIESTALGAVRTALGHWLGAGLVVACSLVAGGWLHLRAHHSVLATIQCKPAADVTVTIKDRVIDARCGGNVYLPKDSVIRAAVIGKETKEVSLSTFAPKGDNPDDSIWFVPFEWRSQWSCRVTGSRAEQSFHGCGVAPPNAPWTRFSTYSLQIKASNGASVQGSRLTVDSPNDGHVGVALQQTKQTDCRVDGSDDETKDPKTHGMTFEKGCAEGDSEGSALINVKLTVCETDRSPPRELAKLAVFHVLEEGHYERTPLECVQSNAH
jgi:hypothetical protein